MNKLKPCPFCGGDPKFYHQESEIYWTECVIKCEQCGIIFKEKSLNHETVIRNVITRWNTRQPVNNWRPIEELPVIPMMVLLRQQEVANPDHNVYVIAEILGVNSDRTILIGVERCIVNSDYIKEKYTDYAPLTPPQTNQSNK